MIMDTFLIVIICFSFATLFVYLHIPNIYYFVKIKNIKCKKLTEVINLSLFNNSHSSFIRTKTTSQKCESHLYHLQTLLKSNYRSTSTFKEVVS